MNDWLKPRENETAEARDRRERDRRRRMHADLQDARRYAEYCRDYATSVPTMLAKLQDARRDLGLACADDKEAKDCARAYTDAAKHANAANTAAAAVLECVNLFARWMPPCPQEEPRPTIDTTA